MVRLPKSFLRSSLSGFGKRARSEIEVGRGTGKVEEGAGARSTGARGSIVEGGVGVGNGRQTASVVGNVDEARVVEVVVAVVEVDVGVVDSERTGVGDLVIPFVLCQEGGGRGFLMGRGLSSLLLAPLL